MSLVLGIDPGSIATGYGVVEARCNALVHVESGVIRTDRSGGFNARLDTIYQGILGVIQRLGPDVSAVEGVFHARNAQSALKLGHARAAAILAAVHGGTEVREYSPLEVKKSVVGYGRAEKGQVQKMVSLLLGLGREPSQDAADALAVAICHIHTAGVMGMIRC